MHLQKYAGYVPCDFRSLFVITSIPKHRHHTTRVPKSPSPERSNDIIFFIKKFTFRVDELEEMLTNSRIWNQKLKNIGVVSKKKAINLGFTGVLLRSTGVR